MRGACQNSYLWGFFRQQSLVQPAEEVYESGWDNVNRSLGYSPQKLYDGVDFLFLFSADF